MSGSERSQLAWLSAARPPEDGTKLPVERAPVVPRVERVADGDDEDGSLEDEPIELIDDDTDEEGMLDDATGERDPIGADDIDEDLDRGEGVDWRDASEDADDVEDDESDESGEEYGWTADAEAQGVEGDDDVLAETTNEPTASEDVTDVEDGPDDDAGVSIEDLLDAERRARSDEADDDGDDLLDLDGEDDVGGSLSYEQEARMTGASLPALDAAAEVAWLGPDEGVIAVAVGAGSVWCLGERLYRRDGDRFVAIEVPGLESLAPNSLAVERRADGLLAIGTALGGALVSEDLGCSWRRLQSVATGESAGDASIEVAVASNGSRARLWGRTRSGRVLMSDDLDRWSDVAGARADVLIASDDGVVIAWRDEQEIAVRWTLDGGITWRDARIAADLSSSSLGALTLAVDDDRIAVGLEGAPDGLWTIDTTTCVATPWPWPSPSALRFGPRAGATHDELGAALGAASNRRSLFAATFLSSIDRGVLVRDPDGGSSAAMLDVGAERVAHRLPRPPEGEPEGRITSIACDGERLLVACSVGVFEVQSARSNKPPAHEPSVAPAGPRERI